MLEAGADAVLLTVRLVPLVPDGKLTVAPAAGKLILELAENEETVPLPVDLLTTDPMRGDVVR